MKSILQEELWVIRGQGSYPQCQEIYIFVYRLKSKKLYLFFLRIIINLTNKLHLINFNFINDIQSI